MVVGILLCVLAGQGQEVNVFAAASLKESFTQIAQAYEAKYPGHRVRLQFAGSQALAAQINQGAPVDVFASAAPKDLDLVPFDPKSRKIFAHNRLVIVTPAGGPTISSLHELSTAKSIIVAAPAVPAGGYARAALDRAAEKYGAYWRQAIQSHIVSEEVDVRAVLTKVELDEADAGIVYATDATSAGSKVRIAPIESAFQPSIVYPIAVLRGAMAKAEARQFEAEVLSPIGRGILKQHGFLP